MTAQKFPISLQLLMMIGSLAIIFYYYEPSTHKGLRWLTDAAILILVLSMLVSLWERLRSKDT